MTDQDTPQTVFDPTTVIRKGFCTVAESRTRPAEPHKLYYGEEPLLEASRSAGSPVWRDGYRNTWRRYSIRK